MNLDMYNKVNLRKENRQNFASNKEISRKKEEIILVIFQDNSRKERDI